MKVKIYIGTSLCGPCVKQGGYAAIMEYIKTDGTAVIREIAGEEEQTTYHRSTLMAAVKAMQMLKPCEVTIYTDCTFIINMAKDGRPEAWRREEWRNAKGEDVAHKELWQQYLDEEKRHTKIEFRFSKHHDYKQKLRDLLKKGNQKAGKVA